MTEGFLGLKTMFYEAYLSLVFDSIGLAYGTCSGLVGGCDSFARVLPGLTCLWACCIRTYKAFRASQGYLEIFFNFSAM